MSKNPYLSEKLAPFGTTIFSVINQLALKHKAINLSQGFPNFPGPEFIKKSASRAIYNDKNQYCPLEGILSLREAISNRFAKSYDMVFDPNTEISIFSGCTEAIFATCMGILNPGEEAILFEPFYDSYPASITMAGASYKVLSLKYPDFRINFQQLHSMINRKTRLIIINTPHNPTGKVFSEQELSELAQVCVDYDLICVSDEVYEHILFDNHKHIPLITLPEMKDRTLHLNSTGKTFSMTGWKIGYAVGNAQLIDCLRKAHQFITFCTSTPLQHGMVEAISCHDEYYHELRRMYTQKRDKLCNVLLDIGFELAPSQGTYFVLADISAMGDTISSQSMAEYMIKEIGVATIPLNSFYQNQMLGDKLIRFCFCKTDEDLEEAFKRLMKLKPRMKSSKKPIPSKIIPFPV